jgi:serine/threonine-protein kinase
MAKLMVREAARNCGDVASLASAVSQHIADQARRAQFLSAATGGSQATALGTPLPAAGTGSGTRLPASVALDEAFLTRAVQLMTRHVGPIARVLVKRSAERHAGDANAFVEALLAEIPEKDREAAARALQGG